MEGMTKAHVLNHLSGLKLRVDSTSSNRPSHPHTVAPRTRMTADHGITVREQPVLCGIHAGTSLSPGRGKPEPPSSLPLILLPRHPPLTGLPPRGLHEGLLPGAGAWRRLSR